MPKNLKTVFDETLSKGICATFFSTWQLTRNQPQPPQNHKFLMQPPSDPHFTRNYYLPFLPKKDLKFENIERERRPEIDFKHVSPKNCSYSRHKFWPFEYISNPLLLAFSTRPHFLNALVVDNFKSILGSYIRYKTRILKCNSKRDTRLKNIYLVLY